MMNGARMNWQQGYSAKYYATVIDRVSWRDIDRFEILSGSINHTSEELRESASIECIRYDQSAERWIRIWLDAGQDGNAEHIPLFTGLAVSPDKEIDGNLVSNSVSVYSVLKPAQDILLDRGWYAGSGLRGASVIRQLLSSIPAPIIISENSPLLAHAIIAEDNETSLSMVDKILNAINWRIKIGGDGTIHVMPKASEPSVRFDSLDNDSIEPSVTLKNDWFSCPNVFRAVTDSDYAVARDDSDGLLSTQTRGREVWAQETGVSLSADETLEEYAKRRLREEQEVAITVSYSRRYSPNISCGDIITLHYPAQEIDGNFIIDSQSIELGYGLKTTEEVHKL